MEATGAVADNATVLGQVRFPLISGGGEVSTTITPALFSLGVGLALGHVVGQVLSQSPTTFTSAHTAPADVVKAWYDVQTMKYSGTVFGPYYSTNCTGNSNLQCQCNLGARSLSVLSPLALSDTSYQYQNPTCRVVYEPLDLPPLASSSPVWPIVLGVVLGAVAVLALVAWLLLRGQRDNWAAPKDASQPFCILFTDIQASTTLWASLPNDMAQALDTHHRLIRTLIRKYRCYEVKTIGDSFMCATKSPAQALRFALALQRTFHAHDWGTEAIDQAYDSLVGAEAKAPQCWNGLRVRVGIHFGHGDIRRDPVSKGYDYYGTVVNTAARIESVCHGGQVGVSEAVRQAVGGQVAGAVWTDLGAQPLRGLREPLRLYQVLPEGALSGRRFPPLRMERVDSQEALEEEAYDFVSSPRQSSTPNVPRRRVAPSNVSTTHDKWAEVHPLVQKGDTTAEELRQHYAILQTGLAALLASQVRAARQQLVRQLCERMHVVDHGAEGQQLLHSLHGLIRRVLPATIAHQAARRTSVLSKPSTATASPANRTSYVGTAHNRHSQQDNAEAQMVLADHRNESGEVGIAA